MSEVYLHIDMGSLDPKVAPADIGTPVPAGIFSEDMEECFRAASTRFRVKAATLVAYDQGRKNTEENLSGRKI